MSANDMLDLVIELFFVGLTIFTVADFVRYRDNVRRDVAFLFIVLGFPFIELFVTQLFGQTVPTWAAVIGIALLIIEPYAMLRVINYLRPISARVMRVAFYGMIISVASIIILGTSLPAFLTLAIQIYFVGLNIYAAVLFVRGAAKMKGIARQRMRFAALGAVLLALYLISLIWSGGIPVLSLISKGLAVSSAISFYIGFSPPRWLRRMWQLNEMSTYLSLMSTKALDARLNIEENMQELCAASNRAVNGMASCIMRKQGDDQRWTLTYVDQQSPLPLQEIGSLQSLWEKDTATALQKSDKLSSDNLQLLQTVGADSLLVAPINTREGVWGLLLVFLRNKSLFLDDDLHFVMLLAQQNALFLTNSSMISELRKLNTELGTKANQLAAANRELESFSYSVSHDLRSPLRALDGFSQALNEDCADQLDEQGRSYIARIRANSQRMGNLIDDLLELSQWTRSELRHEQVDLSTLAQHVVTELREQYPDRDVSVEIEDGLVVVGDTRLLRVVLNNLLGNAWKYTAKQPKPQIKFGMTENDGQRTYYIRDNGAGFDMAYADKLFGTFQRLHNATEFPGNGIGLATVQRIIHRHGGDIWAEAVVGQGATFHFTI